MNIIPLITTTPQKRKFSEMGEKKNYSPYYLKLFEKSHDLELAESVLVESGDITKVKDLTLAYIGKKHGLSDYESLIRLGVTSVKVLSEEEIPTYREKLEKLF